jgi:hypothetical protein
MVLRMGARGILGVAWHGIRALFFDSWDGWKLEGKDGVLELIGIIDS